MIVVDTNIIAYYYVTSDRSGLMRDLFAQDGDWAAPTLWRSEFRNALINYVRHQVLSVEEAKFVMNEAEQQMERGEFSISSRDVIELAAQSDCSAYDCEFVALAKEFGAPLITLDKKILRNFPTIAQTPEQYLQLDD